MTMANSKNTKQYREEKKSGDLSELNDLNFFDNKKDIDTQSPHPEFIHLHQTSVYASKINKTYGTESGNKKQNIRESMDDYSHTSPSKKIQHSSGRTHQLSYDQQFRYQEPLYEKPGNEDIQQPRSRDYLNQEFQQGYSNFYGYQHPYNQRYPSDYHQFHYNHRNFSPDIPAQNFNSFNPYQNRYDKQEGVNRGNENYNYNDQSNKFRSSYNTQGFGNSIYRHENYQPDESGSGYAGSTFGGQGPGEFRNNELFNEQQQYDNPDFRFRQELKNPPTGFNQHFHQDGFRGNNYRSDEEKYNDRFKGQYPPNYEDQFSGFHSPYGNEREEQYGYEREFTSSQKPYERNNYKEQDPGFHDFRNPKGRRRRNKNRNH